MAFIRSIGRWAMTGLVINNIIGSGIFGVPAALVHGDFPRFLSRLHPRFNTPTTALCVHSILVWLLTLTGTFLWVAALSAGSIAVYYFAICAALIGLRKIQPEADAFRLPCGPAWSVARMAICVILFTSLSHRQTLLMGVTALLAALNWWWAQRSTLNSSNTQKLIRFVLLRES